jgi:hypothetical protein
VEAQRFTMEMQPLINDAGFKISTGRMDPVTALLVLRRRIGYFAEQLESCSICRRDIKMAEEFDQFMIDAKQARTTYFQTSKLKAFKMFAKFEWNLLRACLKWTVGI